MAAQSRSGFAMNVVAESSSGGSGMRGGGRGVQSRPLSRFEAFEHDDGDDVEGADGFQRLHGASNGHRNGKDRVRTDEALTGYSQRRGAEKVNRSPPRQGPRVIAKQDNLNWMEERKRRLGLERYRGELGSLASMKMPGAPAANSTSTIAAPTTTSERIGDGEQLSGLQVRRNARSREEEEMEEIQRLQQAARGEEGDETPNVSQAGESPPQAAEAQSEDEAARLALLSGQGLGSASQSNVDRVIPISEEDALKRDTDSRPDAPTMSDYANMPVEDFGAALLRGMGWKEGMGAGKSRQGPTSAPEVKKRVALLGLGAKERKIDEDEGKNKRRSYPERRYVPITRKEGGPSESSSPAPSRHHHHHRDRSQSPARTRERENDRRVEYRHGGRSRKDDDDYERERERRRRRERDRDRERERDRGNESHYRSSRDRGS